MKIKIKKYLVGRKMKKAKVILQTLDDDMKSAGILRAARRQFWREVFAGRTPIQSIIND